MSAVHLRSGSGRTCLLNRNPRRCNADRMRTSGIVSLPRLDNIDRRVPGATNSTSSIKRAHHYLEASRASIAPALSVRSVLDGGIRRGLTMQARQGQGERTSPSRNVCLGMPYSSSARPRTTLIDNASSRSSDRE